MRFDLKGALVLLFSAAFAPACNVHSCPAMGCPAQGTVTADLPATLTALSAELCINDACQTIELSASGQCTELASPLGGRACLAEPLGDARRLTITLDSFPAAQDDELYTLRVTDEPSGEVVIDEMQSPTHEYSQPNGPDCGPFCQTSRVHFSS